MEPRPVPISNDDMIKLHERMAFFDSRPEVEQKLMREFDPADIHQAMQALGMNIHNVDWGAVERMLYWARANMDKHSPLERSVRQRFQLDEINQALYKMGVASDAADWDIVERVILTGRQSMSMTIQ